MQKLRNYLSRKGWKADLAETVLDLKDLTTIVRRTFRPSDKFYKDLTSRELKILVEDTSSLIFNSQEEFRLYQSTNKWPLGPCIIYENGKREKFDDSSLFA